MVRGEDEPLAAGTVIDGRYRVIGELGAGGMGRVYEAEHMFIRRALALKLLRRSAAGPEAAARMIQEATLVGQVPHPAVVRVFDCAALADGQVYVAMELLRGETLEQALRRGLDAEAALTVMAEVARGLAAVHRVGVVHRDIKPANIFLSRGEAGPQAKLLDFGVAKALDRTGVHTQAGAVLGTPHYVAPEQARGGAIDGRADLYSLGVLMYEVLTGELPFVGESFVAILGQHLRELPLDPRQAAPGRGIPDDAARLTMRLLAKDPAARLQDGDAVAEAIAAVLASEGEALRAVATVRAGAADATREVGAARLAEATVRLAGDAGAVRRAEVVASDSAGATVRLAGDAGAVRRAEVVASDSAGATVRLSEGAGARRLGRVVALVAAGAAAVAAWIFVRGPERREAVSEASAVRASEQATHVPAIVTPVAAGVVPVVPVVPVVAEVAPARAVEPEAKRRPPINKGGKKSGREGGMTRPANKAPTKVGGDPPLKSDVYDN